MLILSSSEEIFFFVVEPEECPICIFIHGSNGIDDSQVDVFSGYVYRKTLWVWEFHVVHFEETRFRYSIGCGFSYDKAVPRSPSLYVVIGHSVCLGTFEIKMATGVFFLTCSDFVI